FDELRPEERAPEHAAEGQVPGADREDEPLDDRVDRPRVLPVGLAEALRRRAAGLAKRAEDRALDGHAEALAVAAPAADPAPSRSMTASANSLVPALPPRSEVVVRPSAMTDRTAASTRSPSSG